MESTAAIFSSFFILFIVIFYIAIIVGGIFVWYFIIKKAIIKGIEQSVLNKDAGRYEREVYLLRLELNKLKENQPQANLEKTTDKPIEENDTIIEEAMIINSIETPEEESVVFEPTRENEVMEEESTINLAKTETEEIEDELPKEE